MRIGFFTMTYPPVPDGIATYTSMVREELERRGHKVFVFTTGKMRHLGVKKEPPILRYPSVKMPFYSQYRTPLLPFFNTMKWVKKLDLDIIHCHTPFVMGTCGLIAGRRSGIPVVSTMHTLFVDMGGSFNVPFQGPIIKLAWHASLGFFVRTDMVTVPTETMRRRLESELTRPVDIVTVPNGIDIPDDIAQPHPDYRVADNVIGYIGRITEDKGIDTLMEAVQSLPEDMDVRLLVAGMGPYLDPLRKLKKSRGLDRTDLLGYIPEGMKRRFIASLDVSVLPSRADTFGIVLLEAMREGVPVIGADAAGIPDVIQDGENGLLFEYGDVDGLRGCIHTLLTDVDVISRLKENGLRAVRERFSMSASCDLLEEMYREAIERKDRSGQ